MVKIAIIGGGNVGSTLGKVFSTKAGHTIIYASRDPTADKVKQVVAATPNSSAESIEKAVKEADVLVLTIPWEGVEETAKQLVQIGIGNKILIDATNPIGPGITPALPNTTSGGEELSKWLNGTGRVVKAFNSFNYGFMADPNINGVKTDLLIAGDDAEAKQFVIQLGKDTGFESVDVGALTQARHTENIALFFVQNSFLGVKWGPKWVLKIHRRD
jgi:hypothetical protein